MSFGHSLPTARTSLWIGFLLICLAGCGDGDDTDYLRGWIDCRSQTGGDSVSESCPDISIYDVDGRLLYMTYEVPPR